MSTKITLPGGSRSTDTVAQEPIPVSPIPDLFTVEAKDSFTVSTDRSGSDGEAFIDIEEDDIVEITLNDGSRWFLGEEELAELQHAGQISRSRSGGPSADIILDGRTLSRSNSRGAGDYILKKVRVLALKAVSGFESKAEELVEGHLKDLSKEQITSIVIDPVAFAIARSIEKKNDTNGISSLCQVPLSPSDKALKVEKNIEQFFSSGKPTLLLLHGTLSTTKGSFSDLWNTRPDAWSELHNHFDERVIAYEHCTLTESPIKNALQVVKALPVGATLHILSHSRGGLIGELLCRSMRDPEPFDSEEIEFFEELSLSQINSGDLSAKLFSALKKHRTQESADLKELNRELHNKRLNIERFVRVACPARGTTMASGKLNRWSNRSLNAIGLISGGKANPLYQAFEAFTLGVLKAKSKPEVLPGLHAQMPDSPLILIMNNHPDPEEAGGKLGLVRADLSIVAGDTEIVGFNWKRIPLWLADQFFESDHDLVVNTPSMDGGSIRVNGIQVLTIDGKHVNHFSYFSNPDSAVQIVQRLLGQPATGFKDQKQAMQVDIARSRKREHTGDRPILLLLPGLIGSTLKVNGKRIWMHPLRMANGGISKLSIDAANVTPGNVMNIVYEKFMDHFSTDHDVYTYPYDWRLSLEASSKALATRLETIIDEQEKTGNVQPIRIVTHSMGGLVARYMISKNPALWAALKDRPGSRFVMAGTPNDGSFSINRILAGDISLIRWLALADFRNNLKEVTDITAEYPGLATLLPGFGSHDWMQNDTWDDVKDSTSASAWSIVSKSLLELARAERKVVNNSPLDSDLVGYVAGQAEATASNVVFRTNSEGTEACFEYTSEGDGEVTWADGIPNGLKNVWYQPTVHGKLLAQPKYFQAWRDILESGTTRLLTKDPLPTMRSSKRSGYDPSHGSRSGGNDGLDYLPSEEELVSFAMGSDYDEEDAASSTALSVEVAHGDLSFAKHPVAVGHYNSDSIVHAERVLDEYLDHRLSERHRVGQYPGPAGTSEVVLTQSGYRHAEGALIVGLGELGELSVPMLERTLTKAIIKYLFAYNDWWGLNADNADREKPQIGLSILLIGSGIGGMSVYDSVGVLLRSVCNANKELSVCNASLEVKRNKFEYGLIENLQIIELWKDLAIEAAHALNKWVDSLTEFNINSEAEMISADGGRKRSRFNPSLDWWHTLGVSYKESESELMYERYTRHARVELSNEPVDTVLIDHFLDSIINDTTFDKYADSSPNRALFEMLLPASIKLNSPDSDKIKLKLDLHSAQYPWEMLVDGWSLDKRPLVVSKVIIRQLGVENFRIRPDIAKGNKVLVVGDPPSGDDNYLELPGARKEALKVAEIISASKDFVVERYISSDDPIDDARAMGLKIIQDLMSNEYRILHLAGHGSYYRNQLIDDEEAADEGMVIGERLRLTPSLVNKMRSIPSVVFLNCCHLGHIENIKDRKHVRYGRIAANLATQFIQNGAHVVVAAGWAVDDNPARTFAETFYEHLLANETLAFSISAARKKTFDNFGDSNTFGAYQCWGDPEYRLNPLSGGKSRTDRSVRYVSLEECFVEAGNLRKEAKSAKVAQHIKLHARCEALLEFMVVNHGDPRDSETAKSKEWSIELTQVYIGIARAFGELASMEQAILILRAALQANPAAVTLNDLIELGNFECRLAAERPIEHPLLGKYTDLMKSGEKRLSDVLKMHTSTGSASHHRKIWNLVGSAKKRKAMTLRKGSKSLRNTIVSMRHCYGVGWGGELHSGLDEKTATEIDYIKKAETNNREPDNYSFVNFALAHVVLQWYPEGSENPALSDEFIDVVRKHCDQIETRRAAGRIVNFWDFGELTAAWLLHVIDSDLRSRVDYWSDDVDLVELLKNNAVENRKRIGSERQWASIADHLKFSYSMLSKATGTVNSRKAIEHDLEALIEHCKIM